PPAGAPRRDETPEPRRVIRLAKVAELVDDDVVEHLERREREAPVERQRAARRARSPARALVTDLHAGVAHAERRGLLLEHHRHELPRGDARLGLADAARLEAEPRRLRGALARDPFAMRSEYLVDLAVRHPGRHREHDVIAPRDRQRPAPRAP